MNTTSRLRDALAAGALTLACAALLLATSSSIPIVWDEGDTIFRAEQLAAGPIEKQQQGWQAKLAAWKQPGNWPYTTEREGHPPLVGILIATGNWVAPAGLDPLTRYRLGPIALVSLAAGAMFYRLKRDYGLWIVPLVAVAVLVTMPRMFSHAHFATLDAPLTACWVLAWATFASARRDWRLVPLFAVALGLALSAKFTGWLVPLPFVAWAALYRDRAALRALVLGVPLAIVLFVALNPPLWHDPISGLRTFFDLNLHRGANPGLNITTQFFGRLHNLDHPLPWYNTLVWTAITISPMALLLGVLGIVASVRRWRSDPVSMLLVLQWFTLIIIRALPWAPPHDGVRLFLPSFAFFAALAGVGAGRSLYRDTLLEPDKIVAQGWAKVLIGIALVMSTVDAVSYFPHGLSYYNRLIGGLRGAVALGMEPTYYWDALDGEAIRWLNEHTIQDDVIAISTAPPRNLELLDAWNTLRNPRPPFGRFRWYVVQRRPSGWPPQDRWLTENEQPAYQRTLFGVPLLDVYSHEQYRRARQSTAKD